MSPVLVFDLGKVLVDFDYSIGARKIAARSTKQLPDLHGFIGNSEILHRYETGLLSRRQFFDEMRNLTGFSGDLDEFVSYFANIFLEIPAMIQLHADLRRRGFKSFIFSNTNDIAIQHIRHNFPFFANFDGYIFSYEVGAMKPLPKIYEAMEKMCGARGGEIIYIDDRPENIEAGASRGWKTVLHATPEQTRAALAGLKCL
ncbi:MAG TPA: HAD family phosphatase [Verrucomicrobiae bacterium]|nr:HAD family phosphatase [Verrucomicrobiae bacterium]